jgi:GAF domain-containing protein
MTRAGAGPPPLSRQHTGRQDPVLNRPRGAMLWEHAVGSKRSAGERMLWGHHAVVEYDRAADPVSGPAWAGDYTHAPEPARIQLSPELQSVGRARATLAQLATEWGCPEELIQDARVVLSELMSNGILHARTELQVLVSPLRGGGLRVEVHDGSSLPVVPPLEFPEAAASLLDEPSPAKLLEDHWLSPAATGRGLSMVAALASTWGWSPDAAGGKVVWAELGAGEGGQPRAEKAYAEPAPPSLRPVRLIAIPLRLVKGSEDQFDDLFRELQMAGLAAPPSEPAPTGTGPPVGGEDGDGHRLVRELAPVAANIQSRYALLREPVKRAIWDAARRGDRLMDVDLLADSGLPAVFQMTEDLLSQSAKAARLGLLLTEPPGPEVMAWRRWLRREMEDQIAGKAPRACPFPVAPLREEEGRWVGDSLDAARHEAVAELRSLPVARATGSGQVAPGSAADTAMVEALSRVVGYVRGQRCVLCLLAEDNETVTFGASVGFSPSVMEYWRSSSLSSDLPASEVIRTAKPLFFRTFAELDERYPIFLSTPSESDPALACLPLVPAGNRASLGCLAIGFGLARDFGPSEVSFLKQLVAEISDRIVNQRNDQALRRADERRLALGKARAVMRTAPSEEQVLKELVSAVVEFIADGASVHTVGPNGDVSYLMNRHRDPAREAAAAKLLQKRQLRGEATLMVAECVRSGLPFVVQLLSDEAIAAAANDAEELELLRKLGVGSVGALPVISGGKVVAAVTVANGPGRFISDDDLASVQKLAAEAGTALARGPRAG